MPSAERTILIHRPPADVFAFFADAENDPAWRTAVREISRTGPLQAGAIYRQRVAGPGGRPVEADIEVTAYDPPSSIAFRVIAGPVRPEGSYRAREVPGGTELTFALNCELTGFKKVMSKAVQASMDSEMAGLDRAKAVLEGA